MESGDRSIPGTCWLELESSFREKPHLKIIPKDESAGTGHLVSPSGLYGRTRTHAIHIHTGEGGQYRQPEMEYGNRSLFLPILDVGKFKIRHPQIQHLLTAPLPLQSVVFCTLCPQMTEETKGQDSNELCVLRKKGREAKGVSWPPPALLQA